MVSAFPGAITFCVLTNFIAFATTEADYDFDEQAAAAEEMVVSLMQSRFSLMPGPREILMKEAERTSAPEASLGEGDVFDSTAFAQTAVEVTSAEGPEEKPSAGEVQPAWLAGKAAEDAPLPNEDTMCSKEGLTPGVCAIAALARSDPAAASGGGAAELDFVNPDRLERALFQEIEAALAGTHTGFSAAHMAEVEEGLSGLFAALPKNEGGRLDHPTVRYALHQRFLRRHGWYIRSLNPVGEAQTPASPGEALRGHVPEHLQSLIEKKQEGRGLGLHELAALVATLEHLIQGDMVERLKAAYGAHGQEPSDGTSRSDAAEVLKTYMAHFLSLKHRSGYAVTPEQAHQERASIEQGYGGWQSVADLIDAEVQKWAPEKLWMFMPFSAVLSAAQEVVEKFEVISTQDCQDMKRDLTSMPNGATGEVLLADLHRKALEGSMLFSESTEYLATVGALKHGHRGVSVVVPNYIYSPSNCLGTTSFFDMCCPNECEVMIEELESRLRKPEVSPVEAYTVLHSLRGNSSISEDALNSLDAFAYLNGGHVPIHGYIFANWLHKAFPRECPRPHEEDYSGSRADAEVPAGEHEFQAVAELPFIQASRSDLIAELEEEQDDQADDVREFDQEGEELASLEPIVSASELDGAGMTIDELKSIAARKMATGGLKLATSLDAASLAQTSLDVSPEAEGAEAPEAERGASGLNVRRMP